MHKIKEYMDKIIEKGEVHDMEKIEEYFYKLMCKVDMIDHEMTKWIKDEMFIMANGKVLTHDMINYDDFKWSCEETDEVMKQYGWNLPSVEFNYIANKFYNIYHEFIEDDTIILKMAYKKLSHYPHSAFNMYMDSKK